MCEGQGGTSALFYLVLGGDMDLPSTMNTFCLFVWMGALWIMLS